MGSHRVGHDWSNLAAAAAVLSKALNVFESQFSCLKNGRKNAYLAFRGTMNQVTDVAIVCELKKFFYEEYILALS